ncbi:MAG: tetratricopeptide repeat protein [Blautia sp.]|nr:tetratricopeptide repeat protein [Lachnoclostridium sp.]MCM1210913.1 tetratricopeptide repeat protein [Blautia sp.]
MDMQAFFATLDGFFAANQIERVDSFLCASLEQAKEEKDYGAYISICNEMIGFYRSVSDFRKAYDAAEDVLLLMEELQLERTEHFATTLLNTATAYRAAGNYEQAYTYYRQALQIYEGLIVPDDYRYAGLYNNMSILLEKMGRDEEAIQCAEKALAIIEKMDNGEMETATTLTNLALLYFKVSRYQEAQKLLERALALFEQSGDMTDAHYSGALAGIGEAYYRMGEYDRALESYEKALQEVEKHFGKNESYAVLCGNCAAVCEALGKKEKQKEYLDAVAESKVG